MLADGGLSHDEEDEVRMQMQLLNKRWDALRLRAMDQQTKYLFIITILNLAEIYKIMSIISDCMTL